MVPLQPIESLYRLIGKEVHLEDTVRELGSVVRELRPDLVGAVQVVCSDESERECCEVFQRRFVQCFLPSLKFSNYSPLRLANMGNRYEWGAIRIADNHFRLRDEHARFKIMVVKINSHVAVESSPQGPVYGQLERYGHSSDCCGALHALLEGGTAPFCNELSETFNSEGQDREAVLLDSQRVDPRARFLHAALLNSRLQARKAAIDLKECKPADPTIYLVLPCVTLNRSSRDTEIVCGIYTGRWSNEHPTVSFCGLGTEPANYKVSFVRDRLHVQDEESTTPRDARDHRKLLAAEWRSYQQEPLPEHDRIKQIAADLKDPKNTLQPYIGLLLKSLIAILLELSPVPAVILLFGEGLIDIFRIHGLEKLSRVEGEATARELLSSALHKIEDLPADRAREITELLLSQFESDEMRIVKVEQES